jgi:D-threonate/D-erythronate kinase
MRVGSSAQPLKPSPKSANKEWPTNLASILMQLNTLETQSQPAPHCAARVFILADDVTGACDSAAAFLATGRSARVILEDPNSDLINSLDECTESVLALSTETRNLPQDQAAEVVTRTTTLLRSSSSGYIFFNKIDSAARGHFGAQTMAALEASGAALALVAPAFPAVGRTVHAGLLNVRDAAAQDTTTPLRGLFPNVDATQIDILSAGTLPALEQGIARALDRGVRVLLCDAQTQTDLERLATAACRMPQSILWTGSAGLARALATALPQLRQSELPHPARRDGRTLLFVGTDHPVTLLQVSHLEQQSGVGNRAIFRVDWDDPSHHAIRAAFNAEPTAALVLTGGETAAFVLRALDASSILLAGELAPGIPWGVIQGGDADGCMVITKSGGFGDRKTLADAFNFCQRIGLRRTCASA